MCIVCAGLIYSFVFRPWPRVERECRLLCLYVFVDARESGRLELLLLVLLMMTKKRVQRRVN